MTHALASLHPGGGVSSFVRELADAQERLKSGSSEIQLRDQTDAMTGTSPVKRFSGFQNQPQDLVHGHGLWLPFNHRVQREAQRRKIPFVLSPHGMLEPGALKYSRLKKAVAMCLWQKKDLHRATLLHATAPEEAQTFRDFGLTQPICILPPGVAIPDEADMMHQAKVETANLTALFISRLHPKKNLPLLLEIWAELRPRNWNLSIKGPDQGGHAAELRKLAERLNLSDSVQIGDACYGEDKKRAFQQADLFILPSQSENFGIVVPEALSYGVPVITTTPTPWRELKDRRCGWWVPPDRKSLHDALAEATAMTPEQRQEMGLRGRAYVEERFQWAAIAEQMHSVYAWMLGHGKKPDCVDL